MAHTPSPRIKQGLTLALAVAISCMATMAVAASIKAKVLGEIILRRNASMANLDIEGVAVREDGGFYVVSEGRGSVDDPSRPVTSLNRLLHVADDGTVVRTIELPDSVNALQRRFGFEGVAAVGKRANEVVYVAFQREWVGDPHNMVRIGRFPIDTGEWTFFYYPLDLPSSPNGGWVGLSQIIALGPQTFAVIERDHQAGTDARVTRVYRFSVAGLTPEPQGGVFPVVNKQLVRGLIPSLTGNPEPSPTTTAWTQR